MAPIAPPAGYRSNLDGPCGREARGLRV